MLHPKPSSENRRNYRIRPKLRSLTRKGGSLRPWSGFVLLIFAIGALLIVYCLINGDKDSPTVINEDGEEMLSPERQAKLEKELEEIDNAVQYALLADVDGYYPCYSCPDSKTTIFLYRGEVWKYGTSRISEQRRYPGKNYGAPNLSRLVQYEGAYGDCLKKEKFMIYNYPLLPESKKRNFRLFRPPGNKNDS